jgi:hypothetical protein
MTKRWNDMPTAERVLCYLKTIRDLEAKISSVRAECNEDGSYRFVAHSDAYYLARTILAILNEPPEPVVEISAAEQQADDICTVLELFNPPLK